MVADDHRRNIVVEHWFVKQQARNHFHRKQIDTKTLTDFQQLPFSVHWIFDRKEVHTLRSTTLSGRLNSPTMQSGMAPPHGLALSSLRSKRTVSIPFSWAKISAAQAPDGPPPTTATLYFMLREVEVVGEWPTLRPENEEGEKAVAEVMARAAMQSFIVWV